MLQHHAPPLSIATILVVGSVAIRARVPGEVNPQRGPVATVSLQRLTTTWVGVVGPGGIATRDLFRAARQ